MRDPKNMPIRKSTVYAAAWLAYICFTLLAFPLFNITVMLFSIALAMAGAWLYRYPGGVITTLLSIPYHYIMLVHFSGDPVTWLEVLNPFGIATQLCISGIVALLRSKKDQLDALNTLLAERIDSRTQELNRLRQHIIANRDAQRMSLGGTLLGDIGENLSAMLASSQALPIQRNQEHEPEATLLATMQALLQKSLDLIQNPKYIDYFLRQDTGNLACAVQQLTTGFTQINGTHFELAIDHGIERLPAPVKHLLYRIIHEAIANAIRHAKAELVQIKLGMEDTCYQLTITNTGSPMPTQITMGLGLSLMHYRAHQLKGTISMDSSPDGSTRVNCIVPLQQIECE
jgi:two-component system sensor histidine kinase UhpB